ncbi:MAG: hypothetical protein ACI845_003351 [Gammaproteobacteria bacterium]|jgi:hypothetical protein
MENCAVQQIGVLTLGHRQISLRESVDKYESGHIHPTIDGQIRTGHVGISIIG